MDNLQEDVIDIDEENGIVLVTLWDEFDPNGENVILEYTLDEWNLMQQEV